MRQSDDTIESESRLFAHRNGTRVRLEVRVKKQSGAMNRFSSQSSPAYRTTELDFPAKLTARHYANRVDRTCIVLAAWLAGSEPVVLLLSYVHSLVDCIPRCAQWKQPEGDKYTNEKSHPKTKTYSQHDKPVALRVDVDAVANDDVDGADKKPMPCCVLLVCRMSFGCFFCTLNRI